MRDRDVRDVPGRVGAARHDMNNNAGTETCANCVLNLDHNQLASIPVAGTTVPVDRPSSHDRTLASSLDATTTPGPRRARTARAGVEIGSLTNLTTLNLDHNQLASIPVAGTTNPVDRPSSHDPWRK
jgi:Leucine-rich repeat (LRR) protein